jgi:Fanconi anemia group M protein
MILVSPTEPALLRDVGKQSLIPEDYGADILIPGRSIMVAVQRKTFPADFLDSLYGDRLTRLLMKMQQATIRVMLLEGQPAWLEPALGGALIGSRTHSFTRKSLRGLILSMHHEFGVVTVWTDDLEDTIEFVTQTAKWALKGRHDSLMSRGAVPTSNVRRRASERDKGVYLLQSVEGVGPEMAGRIYDHFGRVPISWDVTADELQQVDGIGPKRAAKLIEGIT